MCRASLTALVMCSIAVLSAFAAEEPVTVTTFQLKDGGKIEALRYSVMTVKNSKGYIITTMEGKKQTLIGNDVISREEESVPFEKLSEIAQKEVLSMRAAAGAAQVQADADQKAQQDTAAAWRKAREARTTLKSAEEALELARTVLASAEKIIKDIPVEIARYDAEYDAAKAELGEAYATRIIGPYPYGALDHPRADYLRNIMVRAAENKVRAEQSLKDAQDVSAHVSETIKKLEARIDTAKKDFEAAEADAKAIAQIAKEDALEREKKAAEPKAPPPDTLTVLTLKDGTTLKAVTILEDPDGRLAVKDEQGKVHYLSAKDIVKREQMK